MEHIGHVVIFGVAHDAPADFGDVALEEIFCFVEVLVVVADLFGAVAIVGVDRIANISNGNVVVRSKLANIKIHRNWYAREDLNLRPLAPQASALIP
jgi:hypothetical protein